MKKDKNFEKFQKMNTAKYEGKCIGMADGRVVFSDKNPIKVMDKLMKNYSDKSIMVTSIPKKNTNFVL